MREITVKVPTVGMKTIVGVLLGLLVGAVAYSYVLLSIHDRALRSHFMAITNHKTFLNVITQEPSVKAFIAASIEAAKAEEVTE